MKTDNMEERIIRAAKSIFIEKGFAETSMSDIAVRIGIARPALHYYFRTKDKLFQAVFGDIILSIVPKVFDILSRKTVPVVQRIEEIVDAYYALFHENPRLPMFVIREMNRDAKLLLRTASRLALPRKLTQALAGLQEEMDDGQLKSVPPYALFYNLYGLLTIPFLTQDMATLTLRNADESFEQLVDSWKPYVVASLRAMLEVPNNLETR